MVKPKQLQRDGNKPSVALLWCKNRPAGHWNQTAILDPQTRGPHAHLLGSRQCYWL